MDIARPPRNPLPRRLAIGAAIVVMLAGIATLTALRPAAPSLDRATLLIDTVRQGDLVREVRGPGTLVPEHLRYITAQASARVERLVAVSGQQLHAGDLLVILSNPDVQIQALQSLQQASAAEAQLVTLRSQLVSQRLAQEGVVASTRTQHLTATQDAQGAEAMLSRGLMSTFEVNAKRAAAQELTARLRIEQERLALMTETVAQQLDAQAAQVRRLRAIAEFQQGVLRSLEVRVPEGGTVQDLDLQLGQWVSAGATLAKVVQPGRLKAVLRIPETQAKDVQLGQEVSVDTRTAKVQGHVSRMDPASQNGTVAVDVSLSGALPPGAVPDVSVDGTVRIETLKNVLYTGRPQSTALTGAVELFRLEPDGRAATRTAVQLGRSSVNSVEVLRGLVPGDRVILSDMSSWDATARVRLK